MQDPSLRIDNPEAFKAKYGYDTSTKSPLYSERVKRTMEEEAEEKRKAAERDKKYKTVNQPNTFRLSPVKEALRKTSK